MALTLMRTTIAATVCFYAALCSAEQIDQVLVNKSELRLYLLSQGEVVRAYDISLGDNPSGHKVRQGDERTPEGDYVLDFRNENSRFYKSIRISYPNEADIRRAERGRYDPGGDIFIHGLPNRFSARTADFSGTNWTDGCIAVNDNEQMEEIWRLVELGTPIRILP